MERRRVEEILERVERELEGEGPVDLSGHGFWKAVGAVKRRPYWVEDLADRIGAIDRWAFERAVRPTFPPVVGHVALAVGTAIGLVLVGAAYRLPEPWNGLALLGGAGALLGATHGLAHVVVGRLVGIRFTHWFLGGPTRVQPSAKTDYASYLRTPPRARAWMHASGALVTKAIPFLLLGAAWAAGVPGWAVAVLVVIGVGQILTDLLYSVRVSDWKRFRREMRVARDLD